MYSYRLQIWHTDAHGQFLQNTRIKIDKTGSSWLRDAYKIWHTLIYISKTCKASDLNSAYGGTWIISHTRRGRSRERAWRRRPQYFEGAEVLNFNKRPPVFFSQNKVGCPPCPYKKFKRKICSQFWDIRQNIFDPIDAVVKLQKNRKLRSGVVLLCWILLQKRQNKNPQMGRGLGHVTPIICGVLWNLSTKRLMP